MTPLTTVNKQRVNEQQQRKAVWNRSQTKQLPHTVLPRNQQAATKMQGRHAQMIRTGRTCSSAPSCAAACRARRRVAAAAAASSWAPPPHSGYHFDGSSRRFFEGWYWKVCRRCCHSPPVALRRSSGSIERSLSASLVVCVVNTNTAPPTHTTPPSPHTIPARSRSPRTARASPSSFRWRTLATAPAACAAWVRR